MPDPRRLPVRGRRRAAQQRRPVDRARVVVLGDLVMDVVLAPSRELERGTDVPGQALLRQGGSAASTARWLGRLGARTTFITAVGRDAPGRALVAAVKADGVVVRAVHVAGAPTGRVGVLVEPGGERSFVADRGAADRLRPEDLRAGWFRGADALHMPAYSLLGSPLGDAGLEATRMARAAGALVTIDLASVGPLLSVGRRAAIQLLRDAAPDLLFATADEAEALIGARRTDGLLDLAPIAIVKRGRKGATVLTRVGDERLRFEVLTVPIVAADSTGAGDAFDAGFLNAWLDARRRSAAQTPALQQAALAGNRVARRHLSNPPGELSLA
jgi:sugar/nucleoside kinase (ribokinase family)